MYRSIITKSRMRCLGLVVLLTHFLGCGGGSRSIPMLKVDTGEYLYLKPDQNVSGRFGMIVGFSLRSSKDNEVVYTFHEKPLELRLEDYDGDGIKDLVYVVADPNVKGANGLTVGFSMRVALGKKNGEFQKGKVVPTMDDFD